MARIPRPRRKTSLVLLVVALVSAAIFAVTSSTAGADARMPIQVIPSATEVSAGNNLNYDVFVSCSIPDGCQDLAMTLTAPAGASGPPQVDLRGVTATVVTNPDNSVTVTYPSVSAGVTRQLSVSWPTKDYTSIPGAQVTNATAVSSTADSPSTGSGSIALVAAPHPAINKTGPATIEAGSTFNYAVAVSNQNQPVARPRGDLSIEDAKIVDTLPAGLDYVSSTGAGVWDPVARTITWNIDTDTTRPGNQLTSGTVTRFVTVSVPAGSPLVGQTVTNSAVLQGTDLAGQPVSVTDTQPTKLIGVGTGTVTTTVNKSGPRSVMTGEALRYTVSIANTGTVSAAGVLTDTIPAGQVLTSINVLGSGNVGYTRPGVVHVTYADGTTTDFTPTGAGFTVTKAGTIPTKVVAELSDVAPGETVSVQLFGTYAAVPGAQVGDTIQNCVDGSLTNGARTVTGNRCVTTLVVDRSVEPLITKSTSQAPVSGGGTHTWTLTITNDAGNLGSAALSPEIVDLIPTQLTYKPGSFALAAAQPATCPTAAQYDVTLTPDYQGSGRTALIAKAQAGVVIPNRNTKCVYTFQTTVNPGTSAGTYGADGTNPYRGNNVYLFDGEGGFIPTSTTTTVDANDLNADGSTTDNRVSATDDFSVADSSQAGIFKLVKGDQDDAFLGSAEVTGQADQVGTSTPGGTVTYQVQMGNLGNKQLDRLVAYDLLPQPGVPGVTDGRYADTAEYQWVPSLTGPIDVAGAPVTVTYSTKSDPCRPEMDATKGSASFYCGGVVDASFVPAASVTDWSTIKSVRFDFGDHVFAGGELYTFTWTMAVPTVDADGDPFVGGERTWNKIAVQASRYDGPGAEVPLLPAEAPWVVDQVKIPAFAVGDYVWYDADKDGVQGAGELPTEGVTVTLTDADGNPVTHTDGTPVTAVTTNAAGAYHFDDLPAGSYVVTFTAPDGFTFTTQTAGSDTTVDSNADTTTGQSAVVVLGPSNPNLTDSTPFDLVTAPKIDRTIDAGFVPEGTPGVTIVKTDAAGNDADTPAGAVTVAPGATTGLVFLITNSGTEPLVGVGVTDAVTDGSASVSDLSCDFSALGGPDTGTTWAGPFAVGASFGCTATLSALAPGDPHTDLATVAGTGQFSGTQVSDDNPWNGVTPTLVSIGDHVWFDTNRDGIQDASEPPVAGVVVNLLDAEGTTIATTTTDATGFYSFTGLTPSTEYQVEFVPPTGTSFTVANNGISDAADSDADVATGKTIVFTSPATGTNSATTPDDPTWDAGLVAIDLTVTKALTGTGPFRPGDTVTFTLVPHNNGPVDALAGWSVTDVLPAGLTLVSLTGTGYDCTVATATCVDTTGARLAADADGGTITVTATIDAGATGTLHNVTYVAPADGDVTETNPLVVPTTGTDTSTTPTNNDDQADVVVDDTTTTTTTEPTTTTTTTEPTTTTTTTEPTTTTTTTEPTTTTTTTEPTSSTTTPDGSSTTTTSSTTTSTTSTTTPSSSTTTTTPVVIVTTSTTAPGSTSTTTSSTPTTGSTTSTTSGEVAASTTVAGPPTTASGTESNATDRPPVPASPGSETLVRTGEDVGALLKLGGLFVAFGLALAVIADKRRRQTD